MRERPRRGLGIGLSSMVVVACLVPCAKAQITPPSAPADSVLWWTLEPAIDPSELRLLHLDPAANRQRYEKAVEAGLAEALPSAVLDRLTFYLNGSQHPELVPMWEAFGWFAKTLEWGRQSELRSRRRLEGHGVSSSGIERILAEGHALLQESWRIETTAREATLELKELVAGAAKRGKEESAERAWQRGNAGELEAATGRERGELEGILDRSLGGKHWTKAVGERILILRRVLDDSDWASLRHMLKHDVASKISTETIEDEEEIGE